MNSCIPSPELSDFVHGKLDPDRLDAIATHLDECPQCQDTVVGLARQDDTFAGDLRACRRTSESPYSDERALFVGLRRVVAAATSTFFRSSPQLSAITPPLETVGPYRIEGSLGVGGMGAVYKAVHSKLKRVVALKLLPEDRWTNRDVITRFEREMEAIGKLDHPNIVRATDAGEDQGWHFLVMEYVDGLDLGRIVRRLGALPVAEACEVVRQAAIGLQYAHDHGLVHRDIKPSNIMLGWQSKEGTRQAEPVVKVLDLGLALLGDEHLQREEDLTTVGQLMGTLDYMSPEQGLDSHDVTKTSDIFSLGATLFKMLVGKSPLEALEVTSPLRKVTTLATRDLPSIAQYRDDLPPELVGLIDQMLARAPENRIASAQEVADVLAPLATGADLRKLLNRAIDAPVTEPTAALLTQMSRRPVPNAPETQAAIAARRGNRFLRRAITLGFAGLVALSAVVFYLVTDYGKLVVKTEVEDVTIEVRQGDRVVETLEVSAGADEGTSRIRSGNYELVLQNAGDTLKLDKDSVTVQRRGQITVTVSRVAEKTVQQQVSESKQPSLAGFLDPTQASDEPTYNGQTYSQIAGMISRERAEEPLLGSVQGLLTLAMADEQRSEEAAKIIITTMRTHGGNYEPAYRHGTLYQVVVDNLPQFPSHAVAAAIKQEIVEGNERSRDSVLRLYNQPEWNVQRHSAEIADVLLHQLEQPDGEWAVFHLSSLCVPDKTLAQRMPDVLAAIKKHVADGTVAKEDNLNLSNSVIQALCQHMTEPVEPAVADLIKQSLNRDAIHRYQTLLALQSAGPRARFMLDDVLELLSDLQIAQATKVSTRGLNRGLLTHTRENQVAILELLSAMDQAATPAIDPLIDFSFALDNTKPQNSRVSIPIEQSLLAIFRNLSPLAEERLIQRLNETTTIDNTNAGAFILLQELNPAAAKQVADRGKEKQSE